MAYVKWYPQVPDGFFKSTHGVFNDAVDGGSICYTTSLERAGWISDRLNQCREQADVIAQLKELQDDTQDHCDKLQAELDKANEILTVIAEDDKNIIPDAVFTIEQRKGGE